jgi:hypothetical protein
MLIQPIDYFLVVWFAVALLSTAYVAWDQFPNNPEPPVMKWGFTLMTLYMGPLGLLLYVLADKEPRPGTHEGSRQRSGSRAWEARFTASPATRPASSLRR